MGLKEIQVTMNEQPLKKIVVDIDNTLWNLAPILWESLKVYAPKIPAPSKWNYWDFWGEYVTIQELLRVLKNIHMQQDKYPPYPDSRPFLEGLRDRGFKIIIASHREKETFAPTVKWLEQNGLLYDEVHLSDDKSVLFRESWAVIDDNPITLDKAARAGIIRAGLLNPWNANSGHPLFDNLLEVLRYIDSFDGRKT